VHMCAYVCICVHMCAYVCICVHMCARVCLVYACRAPPDARPSTSQIDLHWGYTTDDVFYLELAILSKICSNAATLFSVPRMTPGSSFECEYSAAGHSDLAALIETTIQDPSFGQRAANHVACAFPPQPPTSPAPPSPPPTAPPPPTTPPVSPPQPVTCEFTADNSVDHLYFNDIDITSSVVGNLGSWQTVKTVSFNAPLGRTAVLAAAARDYNSPGRVQFIMACKSADVSWGSVFTQPGGGWKVYIGTPPSNWYTNEFDASSWETPLLANPGGASCGDTAPGATYPTPGTRCKTSNGTVASKITGGTAGQLMAFRVAVTPTPPTPPAQPAPPSPPNPVLHMGGDPHARGAHRDTFDFKGQHLGIYVLLSTKFLSLAVQFVHEKFLTPFSKVWVRGSWIRHAYWTIRTNHGRLVKVQFDAHAPTLNGSAVPAQAAVDDVRLSYSSRGPIKTLIVVTRHWWTSVKASRGAPHWGTLRMSVDMQPLYDVTRDAVAPHGLLGQTFDGDNLPMHGKRDSFVVLDSGNRTASRKGIGGLVTTHAMGEGAIEGTAEMYRIKSPFETRFPFSRFDAKHAKPRNTTHV
jgi:hypothetical protein